jgi:putative ABC transport system substrate-binding protein
MTRSDYMRRRDFIKTIVGSAATWPLVVRAKQLEMPVIGYLGLTSSGGEAEQISSFRKGLKEAGFDEGRNVSIEFRFAEDDIHRLPTFVAELVNRKVAVMLAGSATAALVAKMATSTVPIVFTTGADPIELGLVARLNRPGGNLAGVSFFSPQMESKRLGLLHELAPKADLIAVLLNPNNPFFEDQLKDVNEASRQLGLNLHIETASNEGDIAAAFNAFAHSMRA